MNTTTTKELVDMCGDWAKLPDDLIARIISLLPLQDYIRFSAVCRSWCSVTMQKYHRPTSQVPWLLLSDSAATNTRTAFSLYEDKIYNMDLPDIYGRRCCGSSHGWLVTVDDDMVTHLCHPFSRARIQLPRLPAWTLDRTKYYPGPHSCRNRCILKAIISADPSNSEDYVVMALLKGIRSLAFWRPGNFGWIDIRTNNNRKEDAIWCGGKFYAIDIRRYIIVFDPCSSDAFVERFNLKFGSQVPVAEIELHKPDGLYLVDLMGELLVIFKRVVILRDFKDFKVSRRSRTVCFKVFKVDLNGRLMNPLDSIGDYALFLGTNQSVSISASKFNGCRKNCIYFTGGDDWPFLTGDAGIYNLSDGTVEPFSPNDVFSPAASPSVWFDPNIR